MAITVEPLLKGTLPVKTCTGSETTMSHRVQKESLFSATYLDHDHREGEYVSFLAVFPVVHYFWCSPSDGVTVLKRGA